MEPSGAEMDDVAPPAKRMRLSPKDCFEKLVRRGEGRRIVLLQLLDV